MVDCTKSTASNSDGFPEKYNFTELKKNHIPTECVGSIQDIDLKMDSMFIFKFFSPAILKYQSTTKYHASPWLVLQHTENYCISPAEFNMICAIMGLKSKPHLCHLFLETFQ